MDESGGEARIPALGIGDQFRADEGFGARCGETLAAGSAPSGGVTMLDGGTRRLNLLPFAEEADALILLDAVDNRLPSRTRELVRDSDARAFLGAEATNLRQTGFEQGAATARLLGRRPANPAPIGARPAGLADDAGALSPESAARLPAALGELCDAHAIEQRRDGPARADDLLRRTRHEGRRTYPEEARRHGDPCSLAGA